MDENVPPIPPRPSVEPNIEELAPPIPPRRATGQFPEYDPKDFGVDATPYPAPIQSRRSSDTYSQDDVTSPVHYSRNPHKIVAYLVPFPKPSLNEIPADRIPQRFLIYTPPPPPLPKPKDGEKESKIHKLQRKWQEEVRQAKTTDAKPRSWTGVKSKATRGVSLAMSQTKSSDLDFLNRIGSSSPESPSERSVDGDHTRDDEEAQRKAVKAEEMTLVYPSSMPQNSEQLKQEFVNTMLRSRSKAQRDAIIATGLLPVSLAVDILATVIWPFGGLFEIDSVWAYASIQGAKTSRSMTKRLAPSTPGSTPRKEEDKLHLNFTPSPRLQVLEQYLASCCHERDPQAFPSLGVRPTETAVLEAIGWSPSQTGGETRNWEDEQWEMTEVKDDLKMVMSKGGREWSKWCKAFGKDPVKALKK